jgi:hypothetical protein
MYDKNQNLLTVNDVFEIAAKFKYLGTKVTNQIFTREEITSRLNSGNCYYTTVQSPASPSSISKLKD